MGLRIRVLLDVSCNPVRSQIVGGLWVGCLRGTAGFVVTAASPSVVSGGGSGIHECSKTEALQKEALTGALSVIMRGL